LCSQILQKKYIVNANANANASASASANAIGKEETSSQMASRFRFGHNNGDADD